jgi:hypothetical protein
MFTVWELVELTKELIVIGFGESKNCGLVNCEAVSYGGL